MTTDNDAPLDPGRTGVGCEHAYQRNERALANAAYAGVLAADRAAARALVRRAAPFVNAVAVMAEDKEPALAWLADAARMLQ